MSKNGTPSKRDMIVQLFFALTGRREGVYIPRPLIDFCEGDILAAYFLSQLIFICEKGALDDGWIVKSYEDWHEELGMTEAQIKRAIKGDKRRKSDGFTLDSIGVETALRRSPFHEGAATIHYRINFDIFTPALHRFLEAQYGTPVPSNVQNAIPNIVQNEDASNAQNESPTLSRTLSETPETTTKIIAPSIEDAPTTPLNQNTEDIPFTAQRVHETEPLWFMESREPESPEPTNDSPPNLFIPPPATLVQKAKLNSGYTGQVTKMLKRYGGEMNQEAWERVVNETRASVNGIAWVEPLTREQQMYIAALRKDPSKQPDDNDSVPKAKFDPMCNAIMKAFNWQWGTSTDREQQKVRTAAKALCKKNIHPDKVKLLYAECARRPYGYFGPNALENAVSDLLAQKVDLHNPARPAAAAQPAPAQQQKPVQRVSPEEAARIKAAVLGGK